MFKTSEVSLVMAWKTSEVVWSIGQYLANIYFTKNGYGLGLLLDVPSATSLSMTQRSKSHPDTHRGYSFLHAPSQAKILNCTNSLIQYLATLKGGNYLTAVFHVDYLSCSNSVPFLTDFGLTRS